MTDIDRLRQAADRLGQFGEYVHDDRTAALLRAIADADRDLTDGVPSCITVPALDLANVILGPPASYDPVSGDWT